MSIKRCGRMGRGLLVAAAFIGPWNGHNSKPGLRLSSRMRGALRMLADKIEAWRDDRRPGRREKDERLVGALR